MLSFRGLSIPGVFLVSAAAHRDSRGGFTRIYCPAAFAEAGIAFSSSQINLSSNHLKHTLRGMHFQRPPFAEAKIVRVVRGAVFDVVVDLRLDSPAYRTWIGAELSQENADALVIPEGCAHGFITLSDNTDVLYQMGREHVAGHAAGFRFDDPEFAIDWPAAPAVISAADRNWPSFTP